MSYKFDDFHACLNQPFKLQAPEDTELTLSLVSVEKHPDSDTVAGHEVFSVIFRGPAEIVMPQQTYKVTNDIMGELDLFIVPIGPDDSGMCYEAVFT